MGNSDRKDARSNQQDLFLRPTWDCGAIVWWMLPWSCCNPFKPCTRLFFVSFAVLVWEGVYRAWREKASPETLRGVIMREAHAGSKLIYGFTCVALRLSRLHGMQANTVHGEHHTAGLKSCGQVRAVVIEWQISIYGWPLDHASRGSCDFAIRMGAGWQGNLVFVLGNLPFDACFTVFKVSDGDWSVNVTGSDGWMD